jgi:hypothetical protein
MAVIPAGCEMGFAEQLGLVLLRHFLLRWVVMEGRFAVAGDERN